MSAAREAILGRLRRGQAEGSAAAVEARLAARAPGPIPQRGLAATRPLDLFVAEAEGVHATVTRVADAAQVPAAVADYLAARNLPAVVKMAPDPTLRAIPWAAQGTLTVAEGAVLESDPVTLTGAYAGVAETGTLVLLSGEEGPTEMNFLPETHLVVLDGDKVVGTFEAVWTQLRERPGFMPRAINWITGPSRSADIEQTLILGAHGPRRLHIVLIDGESA